MSRMTSLLLGLRSQAGGPRWLGACMAALIALTLGWSAWHAWPVVRAARLPAKGEGAERTDDDRREAFAATLRAQQAQVDGRSMFFNPPRPLPARPAFTDTSPRAPVKPSRYGGPAIIAMVNGSVLFADGQRVKTGESGRGVKVVSLSVPWSAKLEWDGVEFDVELFQRDSTIRPASHSEITPLTPAPSAAEPKPVPVPSPVPAAPGAEPASDPEPLPPSDPSPSADPASEPDPAPEPSPAPPVQPQSAALEST